MPTTEKSQLHARILALQDELKRLDEYKAKNDAFVVYYAAKQENAKKSIEKIEAKFKRAFLAIKDDPYFSALVGKLVYYSNLFNQQIIRKQREPSYQVIFPEFLDCKPILQLSAIAKPLFDNKLTDLRHSSLALDNKQMLGSFCLYIEQIDFIAKETTNNIKPSFGKRLAYNVSNFLTFGKKCAYKKVNEAYLNFARYSLLINELKKTNEYKLYHEYGEHKFSDAQIDLLDGENLQILKQRHVVDNEIKHLQQREANFEKDEVKLRVSDEVKKDMPLAPAVSTEQFITVSLK